MAINLIQAIKPPTAGLWPIRAVVISLTKLLVSGASLKIFAFIVICTLQMIAGKPAFAQKMIEVTGVVLSNTEIVASGVQIVQIGIKNLLDKSLKVGLRAEIVTANNFPTAIFIEQQAQLAASHLQNEFIELIVPEEPGLYRIELRIFDSTFNRQLIEYNPAYVRSFYVVDNPRGERREILIRPGVELTEDRIRGEQSYQPVYGLQFELPDLRIENASIEPLELLEEEDMRVKFTLRNVGGDIGRNIDVQITYYFTKITKRVFPLAASEVDLLVPGEGREMEFVFRFPPKSLLGEYIVNFEIDATNAIEESDEENNAFSYSQPITLDSILLDFPPDNFYFGTTDVLLFRWRSNRFSEFKVELSSVEDFSDEAGKFQIPFGDTWHKGYELSPLPAEIDAILAELLEIQQSNTAYWRVVGRTDQEQSAFTSNSGVRRIVFPENETELEEALLDNEFVEDSLTPTN